MYSVFGGDIINKVLSNIPNPDHIKPLSIEQFNKKPWNTEYENYESYLKWAKEVKIIYRLMINAANANDHDSGQKMAQWILDSVGMKLCITFDEFIAKYAPGVDLSVF